MIKLNLTNEVHDALERVRAYSTLLQLTFPVVKIFINYQKYITTAVHPSLKGCHHLRALGEWRIIWWCYLSKSKRGLVKNLPAIKKN